jgi:hypothetical protein
MGDLRSSALQTKVRSPGTLGAVALLLDALRHDGPAGERAAWLS